MKEPTILVWDIETLPNLALCWGVWKQNIQVAALRKERSIIGGGYKFLNEDTIYTTSIAERPRKFKKDPWDDEHVVRELHKILSKVDILIHHNGDKFDLKFFKSRAFYYRLPPLPPIQTIDTLKAARKEFRQNFNSLAGLAKFLKIGSKDKTEYEDWVKITEGDIDAVHFLMDYCKTDVTLLEKVYLEMRRYMTSHPNLNVFTGDRACTKCGSKRLKSQGIVTTKTRAYRSLRCLECLGWSQETTSIMGVSVK